MSQKSLADKLHVSQAAISQFENNTTTPRLDTIKKIAEALDVPYFELIDLKLNDGSFFSFGSSFDDNESIKIADDLNNYIEENFEKRGITGILNKFEKIGITYHFDINQNSNCIEILFNDKKISIDDKTLISLDKDSDDYLKFKVLQLEDNSHSEKE